MAYPDSSSSKTNLTARKHRPGPKGTSCLTCKQRHKKCDQSQPICERCKAGQFECLGYGHIERAPVPISRPRVTYRTITPQIADTSSHPTLLEPEFDTGILEYYISPEDSLKDIQFEPASSFHELPTSTESNHEKATSDSAPESSNTSLVKSQPRKAEDCLYLFATQSAFKSTDSPMSILRKLVDLQTQLPHSSLNPLRAFLNNQWCVEYILMQSDKVMDSWYFKPINYKRKHFLGGIVHRIQSSHLSRWITLVGVGVVQSFLAGDMSQSSQHRFWLGCIEHSAKHELSRDLAPRETQERRREYLHVSLIRAMILHGSNIYQILRSLTPTFLQVVFSNSTIWPCGSVATYVPLSNVLRSEAPELAFFAFMDCTCAMAFGLPQQVEYDTTIYSQPSQTPAHQWAHSTPIDFELLLAEINACRDQSPISRDWREIEQQLLAWQSQLGEHTFTEPWMTIAWYAVQESWRLALLVYLYMAVCNAPSDDTRIQSYIKQILQVTGTVRERGSSSVHVSFFVQYLIVGICARSEMYRAAVREKLSSSNATKLWILRAPDLVPVLDHLWHGAAAGGRPVKWSDYVRSREAMLPVVI